MATVVKPMGFEDRFEDGIKRFLADTVGLKGDFVISRVRISGGTAERPVIDLRIVERGAGDEFTDTGSASVDRVIFLLTQFLPSCGGFFHGSATLLSERMTAKTSPLSKELRKMVPTPCWLGKTLSQVVAVGSRSLEVGFKKQSVANVWTISLK